MNIKNSRAITLVMLVIVVIVLVIIVGVTVSAGINISKTARFENVETNLLLIQSKIKVLAEKRIIGEIEDYDLYGTEQSFRGETGWYELSQGDLNEIGLKDAKYGDGYYVFYAIREEDKDKEPDVGYEKGISLDERTYYKLSEILAERNK